MTTLPPLHPNDAEAPLLSVIIPVFNERATLPALLDAVRRAPFSKEILVIDDGSTDGTRELLRAEVEGRMEGIRVFYQERNQGKGAAVRWGLRAARGRILLIQDADLEYSPAEYGTLLAPILAAEADVVYGSRFRVSGEGPRRLWHVAGNRFLTGLSNLFTGLRLTDMETCYKAFRREVVADLSLEQNRFGFEPEVTAKIARRGWRVVETPVSYQGRGYAEGKKIRWTDGVHALWCIVRYAYRD